VLRVWTSPTLSYFEAEAFCVAGGGHLMTVDSAALASLLQDLTQASSITPWIGLWSGGIATVDTTRYRWLSGRVSSFDGWARDTAGPGTREPNNGRGGEEGVCVNNSPTEPGWYDNRCWMERAFVCESPA
jgi:hypothetical protein